MRYSRLNMAGMTLVEVMIATGVFLMASVGILYSLAKCIELNEVGKYTTVAAQGVRNKMEEIKASSFAQVFNNYNGSMFTITGLNGRGVVYVDNSNSRLLTLKVVYSLRVYGGRVIGEDTNLNGVLDTGEDKNGNGQIDSSIEMVTKIYG